MSEQTYDPMYDPQVPESEILGDESTGDRDVPVVIRRPVRIQQLPSELAGLTTYTLGTPATAAVSQALRIPGNPKQRRLILFSFDEEIRLGTTEAVAESDQSARWPKLVPLTLETRDEIWLSAAVNQTVVSVLREYWSE